MEEKKKLFCCCCCCFLFISGLGWRYIADGTFFIFFGGWVFDGGASDWAGLEMMQYDDGDGGVVRVEKKLKTRRVVR